MNCREQQQLHELYEQSRQWENDHGRGIDQNQEGWEVDDSEADDAELSYVLRMSRREHERQRNRENPNSQGPDQFRDNAEFGMPEMRNDHYHPHR